MKKEKDITLREYFQISRWVLGIGFKISPRDEITKIIGQIVGKLVPLATTYITARIIDALVSAYTSKSGIESVLPYIFLLLAFTFIFDLISELSEYSSRKLSMLITPFTERMEYEKVRELGPQSLEFPDISNLKQKADDWMSLLSSIDVSITNLISYLVRIILIGVILYKIMPLFILLVIIYAVIFYLNKRKYFQMEFDWIRDPENISEKRKHYKISSDLSNEKYLGEIAITGAYNYLDSKFKTFMDYYSYGYIGIFKKECQADFLLSSIGNLASIFGYFEVFVKYLAGLLTIGNVTFYIGIVNNFFSGVERLFRELALFRDNSLKIRDVYTFFKLEPNVKDGKYNLPRLIDPPEVSIRNVSFHYPNNNINILKDFSLTIKAGEKIAIVGENGAGKSTLVKLLSRIYDPQEGEILVNGKDLRDIKVNDWYKNLGVLFQDFNFYGELSAEENIYLGKSIKSLDNEKVAQASKSADAYDFIQKYPDKFKTTMSEKFKDGIQPSKGQQQKIAIARFFYRDAPFAIFDEPTSAIDAESEYRIFNEIYRFFKNKTVIIISHRFSTVRNANRIVVLDKGKIVEEGSHEELLKLNGKYANAFRKQAEGYR